MKNLVTLLCFTCLFLRQTHAQVSLTNFATGFTRACDITHCGDDRLFVVEQGGKIWILDENGTKLPTPFLDIDPKVGSSGNEQGLLGMAFHPHYAQNGYFYVNYTDNNGDTKISRFSVSAGDPNLATSASELILLEADQPYSNHNGGCVKFGPDGYLYIGLGDGGSGGDPQDNGQKRTTLLGKMLRIDVDNGSPYAVPADNPFVSDATTLDEIWALGLRNPWRFSFDRLTGDLWIGDVGQDAWEEVDFQPASSTGGENYGWRCYEGNHTFNTANCPNASALTMPVAEYANSSSLGCSMTGGFVYRGFNYPQLYGRYLYTDYCSGRLWSVVPNGSGGWTNTQIADLINNQLVSFGENKNGELFMLGNGNGIVYRIHDAAESWTYEIETDFSPCANGDGTIEIVFSNNTPSPTVAWSDGGTGATRTGLAAGSYTATITGTNGAVAVETILLDPAQTISLSSDVTDASCLGVADGSIDLTLEGTNEPPTSVVWEDPNGASGSTDLDRTDLAAGEYTVIVTSAEGCVFEDTFNITATNPVSLISVVTDIECTGSADGSINLTLEGTNEPPASVVWGDGNTDLDRTDLPAGEYTVTITSAEGCVIEESFEIVVLGNVTLTGTVTDALCSNTTDGSIDLTLEGTTEPPTTVIWSDGSTDLDRTDLAAGEYTVTITSAEGCILEETFEVVASSNVSLTSVVADVPCPNAADGSIDLTLNGTNEPPTAVIWGDGSTDIDRTGLAAGEYTVTVTSAEGCIFEETFEIGVSSSISLTSVVADVPCTAAANGSIDLTLEGTNEPPTAVVWEDGSTDLDRTGLAAGEYTVTVTSAEGCVFEDTFEIAVADILSLTGVVTHIPCSNADEGSIDLTLNGTNDPPAAVVWNDGSTDFDRTGLAGGQYAVTVTSVEGCTFEETFEITVAAILSLTGVVADVPCATAANGSIDLTLDGSAEPPTSVVWSDGSTDFDRTDLAAGEYTVTVTSAEACVLEETFEVAVADILSLTGVVVDVPCTAAANGSIDLTLDGTTVPPASITWNDGSTDFDRTDLAAGEYTVTVTSAEGCTFEEAFEVVALNSISLTGTVEDVPCAAAANGSIDLTLDGTTVPPATVIWNDDNTDFDRTDLAAGEYTVTVTTAEGCVVEGAFEVTVTDAISLTGVVTNESCPEAANGSIDLTLGGTSTPPATVVWNDGNTDLDRTDLAPGSYAVTVTSAEGCLFEQTFEIIASPAMTLTGAVADASCPEAEDGSIDLTLSGGTLAAVVWSDGSTALDRTGLSSGEYTVTVTTTEGCVLEETFEIGASNAISLTGQATNATCTGAADGSIDLTLSGTTNPPANVVWGDGNTQLDRTGLTAGQYTVTVTTAEGCIFSQNFTVTEQFTSPTPVISQQNGGGFVLEVNGTYVSYQWLREGEIIDGANGSTYDVFAGGVAEGNYSVIVVDANGCTGVSNSLYIEWLATNAIPGLQSVKVTPNPFRQLVRLEVTVSEPVYLQMTLNDLQGKTVFKERLAVTSTTTRDFDFGHLPAGTYLLVLKNGKGEWMEKLIKL